MNEHSVQNYNSNCATKQFALESAVNSTMRLLKFDGVSRLTKSHGTKYKCYQQEGAEFPLSGTPVILYRSSNLTSRGQSDNTSSGASMGVLM